MLSKREEMNDHLALLRINLIWLDMFFSGKFDTEEKWRDEMNRRNKDA